jgi:hypothetical protein
LRLPVNGCHRPRDADAQENVDGVGTGDVADRVVGGFVSDGGHLTGKGIYMGEGETHVSSMMGRCRKERKREESE